MVRSRYELGSLGQLVEGIGSCGHVDELWEHVHRVCGRKTMPASRYMKQDLPTFAQTAQRLLKFATRPRECMWVHVDLHGPRIQPNHHTYQT